MRIPRTFLQENGRKGGRVMSERKRKAILRNLKVARQKQAILRAQQSRQNQEILIPA